MGCPEDQLDMWLDMSPQQCEDAQQPPPILAGNGNAFRLFLGLQTQWRIGLTGVTGLEYQAIEPTARLMGMDISPDSFMRLQVLESAFLGTIHA